MNRQGFLRIGAAFAALACATLLRAAASFTPDSQPVGYIGELEVTNYMLTSGHEVVFKTDYDRNTWTGNVHAYPVDAAGVVALQADWWNDGAASDIDAQDFNTGRIIVTDDGKSNAAGKPFRWASLSGAQQGAARHQHHGAAGAELRAGRPEPGEGQRRHLPRSHFGAGRHPAFPALLPAGSQRRRAVRRRQ